MPTLGTTGDSVGRMMLRSISQGRPSSKTCRSLSGERVAPLAPRRVEGEHVSGAGRLQGVAVLAVFRQAATDQAIQTVIQTHPV